MGFFAGHKFNKISVEGGAVVPLAAVERLGRCELGPGRQHHPGRGVQCGPDSDSFRGGGAPTKVTDLADGEIAQADPQILPGGKAVLFTAYSTLSPEKAHIDVVTLADGRRKTLVPGGTSPRYLATSDGIGHLVYTNQGDPVRRPVRSGASGDAWDGGSDSGRRGLRLGGRRRCSLMSPETARWCTAGAAAPHRPG